MGDSWCVEAVLLDAGENHVELLAPLGPETPVGRFLANSGPGLHHVAYQVKDIDAALDEIKAAGLELIDSRPRAGRNFNPTFGAFLRAHQWDCP